jgi:hypothetical protein
MMKNIPEENSNNLGLLDFFDEQTTTGGDRSVLSDDQPP